MGLGSVIKNADLAAGAPVNSINLKAELYDRTFSHQMVQKS